MHSFDRDKFHVISVISNSARFSRRYELYRRFAAYMEKCGVNFHTVELQLGDRPFSVTDSGNPKHYRFRSFAEIWHKENLINLGISKLPDDWETVAWIDADVEFLNENWVEETLHQLQVYQIVQMWQTAVDLGPHGEVLHVHRSFVSEYIRYGCTFPERRDHRKYAEFHPGYAWAARREAIDGMGGIYDRSILGAGDRAIALALVGKAQHSFHPESSAAYKDSIMHYQEFCEKTIRRDVGYVSGSLKHFWHGKKADRRYWDRWKILVDNNFKPHHDVKLNSQGILELHDDHSHRSIKLRDAMRGYFRTRNEDSIDLE